MNEYHKINTIYKRDLKGDIIIGDWSDPIFEYLKNNIWTFTEKVDGTNIRAMYDGGPIRFGGKTENASIPAPLIARLNCLFSNNEKFILWKEIFKENINVCFYGEGYGARIQKNGGLYKADGQDFVLFDIKINNNWLERSDVNGIAARFGIQSVPIIGEGTISEVLNMAQAGIVSKWGEFQAEGIVARPKIELKSRNGSRIITKIKHKDFSKIQRG